MWHLWEEIRLQRWPRRPRWLTASQRYREHHRGKGDLAPSLCPQLIRVWPWTHPSLGLGLRFHIRLDCHCLKVVSTSECHFIIKKMLLVEKNMLQLPLVTSVIDKLGDVYTMASFVFGKWYMTICWVESWTVTETFRGSVGLIAKAAIMYWEYVPGALYISFSQSTA